MASLSDTSTSHSKRPHVKTERMQEFIRSQGESSSPTKKLKCPEACCSKVFTSSPGLKYHLQTHNLKDPQFSCRKCHKVFKSANGLKYHREKTKCDDAEFDSSGEGATPGQESAERPCRLVPSCLDLGGNHEVGGMDKLTELAIIATSPQSPLMQKPKPPWDIKPSGDVVRSLEKLLNKCDNGHEKEEPDSEKTYKSQCLSPGKQPTLTLDCNIFHQDGSDPHISSSSPLCVSATENDSLCTGTWSHIWPTAVWQCFIKGTQIKFLDNPNAVWQRVEMTAQKEELAEQASLKSTSSSTGYASDGLCIRKMCDVIDEDDQSDMEIHFTPGLADQSDLLALCQRDHPFFVRDKGWSSRYPCETVVHYGIPCSDLCVGDVCLPPSHPVAAFSEEIFKSFEGFDFTPEDTSAVFALSSMKQRKDLDLSPKAGSGSARQEDVSSNNESPVKAKRPMNAFMLFAKEFRLGYTQSFPKRDNRAISVMLGEQWKALSSGKKQIYEAKARLLADRQKKMHPDCWKRKK